MYSGYAATTTTPQQAGEKQPSREAAKPQPVKPLVGLAVQGLSRNLPEGWEMKKSRSTGKTYYINEKMGKSQFEPPEGSSVKADPKVKKQRLTHSKNLPDAQKTDKIGMMGVIRGSDKQAGRWAKWAQCSRSLEDEEE